MSTGLVLFAYPNVGGVGRKFTFSLLENVSPISILQVHVMLTKLYYYYILKYKF